MKAGENSDIIGPKSFCGTPISIVKAEINHQLNAMGRDFWLNELGKERYASHSREENV